MRGANFGKGRKRLAGDLVGAMYAEYQGGATLAALGRKYGRERASIREVFRRRGLELRPHRKVCQLAGGRFAPYVPATEAEIAAAIERMPRPKVPPELAVEWRHWSDEQRARFVARVRQHFGARARRPDKPFSKNVEPFDYFSERAWVIADKANSGLSSRYWRVRLFPFSEGVIYRYQLWFWCAKSGGYFLGPFRPGIGRPSLHHTIWEETYGPVPPHHVVCCRDGNQNNLVPENLVLKSRADLSRENRAHSRLRESREQTALLLQRFKRKGASHGIDLVGHLVAARAAS